MGVLRREHCYQPMVIDHFTGYVGDGVPWLPVWTCLHCHVVVNPPAPRVYVLAVVDEPRRRQPPMGTDDRRRD